MYECIGGPCDGKMIETDGSIELLFPRNNLIRMTSKKEIDLDYNLKTVVYLLINGKYRFKGYQ